MDWEHRLTWGPVDDVRSSKGPDLVAHSSHEVLADLLTEVVALMQGHICVDPLTLNVVIKPAEDPEWRAETLFLNPCTHPLYACSYTSAYSETPVSSWQALGWASTGELLPDHCSLNAGTMGCQGSLHLGSAHTVPADIDDVIHPACNGVQSICTALAAVPSEVEALRAKYLAHRLTTEALM